MEKTPTKQSPASVTAAMANDDDCDGLSGKSVRERAALRTSAQFNAILPRNHH